MATARVTEGGGRCRCRCRLAQRHAHGGHRRLGVRLPQRRLGQRAAAEVVGRGAARHAPLRVARAGAADLAHTTPRAPPVDAARLFVLA